jgi:hypothetical protein
VGKFVVRKQVAQFVPEDGHAAWLEADDRHTVSNLRRQRAHHMRECAFGSIEHAVIVERTSTADWL